MSGVEGFDGGGILLAGTNDATISHVTIQDNGGVGIQLTRDHNEIHSVGNTVWHSVARYNGLNGIDVNADSTFIYKNSAFNNGWNRDCDDSDRNGILVWGVPLLPEFGIDSTPSRYNIIEDNDAFENDNHGIWVGASRASGSFVLGNVVKNNRAFHNHLDGIVVFSGEGGVNSGTRVESNTMYGNGIWGTGVKGLLFEERAGGHIQASVAAGNQITSMGSGCVNWGAGAEVSHYGNYCNGSVIDPVSPLTVTIDGPDSVQPSQISCTWNSIVSGGIGPYTYSWQKDSQTVGHASSYSTSIASTGFQLVLTVTDSREETSYSAIQVLVSQSGSNCIAL